MSEISSKTEQSNNGFANARTAMAVGWALGIFEAGLVYSLKKEVVEDPMFLVVGPLAPMVLYGYFFWVCGKIADLAKWKFPWTIAWCGGLMVLFLLRAWGGLNPANWNWAGSAMGVNWLWTIPGSIASIYIWRKSFTIKPQAAKRFGIASLFVLPVFWLMFAGRGQGLAAGSGPNVVVSNPSAPNVVLVTWDTVRADSLPIYGGGGLDTPNLDRLASEGLVFDNFHAVASITAPAHTSILSGLYPPTHGLRSNGLTSPVLPTPRLPRILANEGYATAAFVSGYSLKGAFGFDRDFQVYDYRPVVEPEISLLAGVAFSSKFAERLLPRNLMPDSKYIPGEVTLKRAQDWLQETGDRPAFLWAHFFDAHHPYNAPQELRERALARASEGPHAPDAAVEDEWVMQRAEIERIDILLGQLLLSLEQKDPGLKNTVIALVADHGECFGEGGHTLNHHYSLFDATQRIVCVIRPAGGTNSVRRPEPGSQIDVMPTVLAMAGFDIPEGVQGHNLMLKSKSDRGLYMEAYQRNLDDKRLLGWLKNGWKYVRSLGGEEFLYRSGEGLEQNLIDENPEIAEMLAAELEMFLQNIETNVGVDNQSAADINLLNDLGYTDSDD